MDGNSLYEGPQQQSERARNRTLRLPLSIAVCGLLSTSEYVLWEQTYATWSWPTGESTWMTGSQTTSETLEVANSGGYRRRVGTVLRYRAGT